MSKRKGFTLIELLVVISIIALLLSILMPSLSKVKDQARAVVCMSNLKQWGLSYMLYSEDNDGKFAEADWDGPQNTYMEVLRGYYANINEIRTCPMAPKPQPGTQQGVSQWGSTIHAWSMPEAFWTNPDDWGFGSYGENAFIRQPDPPNQNPNWHTTSADYWGKPNVPQAYQVPLLMDCRWQNLIPDNDDPVPYDGQLQLFWEFADVACMRRHSKGLNMVFLDQSAKRIDAEELWNLKWHQSYLKKGSAEFTGPIVDGIR